MSYLLVIADDPTQ